MRHCKSDCCSTHIRTHMYIHLRYSYTVSFFFFFFFRLGLCDRSMDSSAAAADDAATAKLPQKRLYRQRAHANPLSEGAFDVPRSPREVDWAALYPSDGREGSAVDHETDRQRGGGGIALSPFIIVVFVAVDVIVYSFRKLYCFRLTVFVFVVVFVFDSSCRRLCRHRLRVWWNEHQAGRALPIQGE